MKSPFIFFFSSSHLNKGDNRKELNQSMGTISNENMYRLYIMRWGFIHIGKEI